MVQLRHVINYDVIGIPDDVTLQNEVRSWGFPRGCSPTIKIYQTTADIRAVFSYLYFKLTLVKPNYLNYSAFPLHFGENWDQIGQC